MARDASLTPRREPVEEEQRHILAADAASLKRFEASAKRPFADCGVDSRAKTGAPSLRVYLISMLKRPVLCSARRCCAGC